MAKNKKRAFTPPEEEKGRDDWTVPSNPDLKCPEHIVASGSMWFCTKCGMLGYCQYEHGIKEMFAFITEHKDCGK